MKKLFVCNLDWDLRDADIIDLFKPYGEVLSARVARDRETDRSRGYAFVTMADHHAQRAIEALNGSIVEGRQITVQESRPKFR